MTFLKNLIPAVLLVGVVGAGILIFLPIPGAKFMLLGVGLFCGALIRSVGFGLK